MKPILIAAVLLLSTFTKSFASDGTTVEPLVLKSFHNTFTAATQVDWSVSEELYKAVFFLNGQYVTAYYSADGSMQALTRHITASNLPVLLQAELKNTGKGKWVSDVLEVTQGGGGLQYYVTLEDADSKVVLKSAANTWSTFQKQRKN